MTWVAGQTTWGNLIPKLTGLITGEVADDSAVSVAAGDRWIREIAGQDLLRAPAPQDMPLGDMSNRMGYWSLQSMHFLTVGAQLNVPTPIASVCRQTTLQTTVPSVGNSPNGRWHVRVSPNGTNTVPGVYNQFSFSIQGYDADTGTLFYNSSTTPTAGGVLTLPTTVGGGQVTVSNPTGVIVSGTAWIRAFDTTYTGGIDYWPHYSKRSADHSFSVAPSGVSGTDWDVVDIVAGSYSYHYGLGIKTLTGLSGDLYTVTWPIAMKLRLVAQSGVSNGIVNMELFGGGKVDTVYENPTFRMPVYEGYKSSSWLRPFSTPGSVEAGSAIQYWMSVTPTKIAIVLNADPGASGLLTCNWVGKFTPYFPDWDLYSWFSSHSQAAVSGSGGNLGVFTLMNLNQFKWRSESISVYRDWQTGWMRWDTWQSPNSDSMSQMGSQPVSSHSLDPVMADVAYWNSSSPTMIPARSNKPSTWDGKWGLHGVVFRDKSWFSNTVTTGHADDRVFRGYIDENAGALYIPGIGWASGDELTDTVTGEKWFLIEADYHGIFARYITSSGAFSGGAAILEE